jgi:hypothetical protein
VPKFDHWAPDAYGDDGSAAKPGLPVMPTLTVVPANGEPPAAACTYDAATQQAANLAKLIVRNRDGEVVSTGNVTTRLLAMLRANLWSAVTPSGDHFVAARTTWEPPDGGILRPMEATDIIHRAQSRYNRRFAMDMIPSAQTVRTALGAFAGEALTLPSPPFLRWGRGLDGALWWDAGRKDNQCVRVDGGGWQIVDTPGCWFVRSPGIKQLRLPADSGDLDELWSVVNVDEHDRPLVRAWMVASTQPETASAAGILYLSGPEGSGKSSGADKIVEAAGSSVARKKFDPSKDDRDFLVSAAAAWTISLDNLSSLTSQQQDLLCLLATGFEESYRRLYTDSDTTLLQLRRPITTTSIEIPILHPDLISRMVPAEFVPLEHRRAEDELAETWAEAQPRAFAGLLTLVSQVMAAGRPEVEHLPRLAVLGRMAHVIDGIYGTNTILQLETRQGQLLSDSVTDDPFFDTLRAKITGTWEGSAADLDRHLDPGGELRKQWGKQWPAGKAITSRLKRHRVPLTAEGWTMTCTHDDETTAAGSHKPRVWTIIAPTDGRFSFTPKVGGTIHGPACHCAVCLARRPVSGCRCDECSRQRDDEPL